MGLEDAEWVARWRAARNGATGPEALQDPNADVRLEAVRALAGKLDEATLAKLVHDPDWEVRWEALRVLAHDERFAAKRWKGAIRAALRDPQPAVVASACRDLMESPERCEQVEWEEIVGALEHHGATARRAALRLVGEQYLYEVLPLRPALRPRLDDDDIAVRAIAASLLHGAEEGPWMRRAIAKALGDPQPAVRAAALRNLTIRSVWALPEALPALVALLPDPRIGDEAANALGSCGAAAEDAAPALRAALAARDEADFRYVAARALFRITGDPAPLLAVARALLARDAGRDRIWAIRAFKVVADEAEGQAAIDAREELRAARKR
jgi:hypothetical protein